MSDRLLILGAGPTGLGAAYRLGQVGHENWSIRERNGYVGGLSASFRDDRGFTWDVGGHVVFSHYPEFDRFFEEMTRGEVFRHERKSYIRIASRWVPYPFQNNIRHLPPELLEECLQGLEEASRRPGPPDTTNFLAWNVSRLGRGITRCFLQPDNEKRWACPLDMLSATWVGDRVSPVDYGRIVENVRLERDDISWGPNKTFQFPRHGGTGAIFEAMVPRLGERLRLSREAVSIDPRARTVRFSDGSQESYDALLTTIPLDHLLGRIEGAPEPLVASARRLRRADGLIVGIGLNKPVPTDKCWIYCPDAAAPHFRTTYFSNYSPFNAPDEEHYSLMCDISHSDLRPRNRDTIVEETIQGLIATGILAPEDRDAIVSTYRIDAPYTYPVPTLERDAILDALHAWLEPLGIHSRGRFGAWLYEIGNMDHSVVMGMQWVDSILSGERENVWLDRV
ncbi:FAD-dependent oxidoreductase [Candidatus Sumerlaeota bacterium]|nr:FAD-dependent oxidoreductase [Candidatus Sumerlaeota bacterium]